jgi:hypothetical protein
VEDARSAIDGEWLDEALRATFPASDPLSNWAGAIGGTAGPVEGRLLHREPAADAPERAGPGEPVPSTMPPEQPR